MSAYISSPIKYIGFADGALRPAPSTWSSCCGTCTWSFNILIPLLVLGLFIVLVAIYLRRGVDHPATREHHIAQRPRNAATRTAIGAAGVTFYAVLWAAASSDIIATHFWLTMEGHPHPAGAAVRGSRSRTSSRSASARPCRRRIARSHCTATSRDASVRLPAGGEYIEVHQPVDQYEAWPSSSTSRPTSRRAPQRQGPDPAARELPRVDLALVLRGPTVAGDAGRARGGPHQHHTLDHVAEEEDAEIQGMHERAGVSDAPHHPIDDGHNSETANRPSNVIILMRTAKR